MADLSGFMQSLGFQQTDPNNPFQQSTPGLSELIARLASTLGPASHFIGGTRTPLGRALGATSLMVGAGAGSIADQLEAQRKDPLAQQMRLAQYIQNAGTAPTPGMPSAGPTRFALPEVPPDLANMTLSTVQPGQQSGFPGVAGPQGAAKFDINNLSPAMRLVGEKAFPQIDPLKDDLIKAQIRYTNAHADQLLGGGDLSSNLPNRIAIALATRPDGTVDWDKAKSTLLEMRTTPESPLGRIYNYIEKKNLTGVSDPKMEAAINEYLGVERSVNFQRGAGGQSGRDTERNTPLASAAAGNVAAGTERGKLSVLSSPEYLRNQGDIAAARETAQRLNTRMSPEQERRYTQYAGINNNLNVITQTYKPEYVGGIPAAIGFQSGLDTAVKESMDAITKGDKYQGGAIIGRMKQYLGNIPPDQARFYRAVMDNADRILRARSGAQINNQEATRLMEIAPKATDMPAVFEAKFGDFANDVMGEQRSMLEAITQSPESIRRGLPTTSPQLGRRGLPAPPTAPRTPAQDYLDGLRKELRK